MLSISHRKCSLSFAERSIIQQILNLPPLGVLEGEMRSLHIIILWIDLTPKSGSRHSIVIKVKMNRGDRSSTKGWAGRGYFYPIFDWVTSTGLQTSLLTPSSNTQHEAERFVLCRRLRVHPFALFNYTWVTKIINRKKYTKDKTKIRGSWSSKHEEEPDNPAHFSVPWRGREGDPMSWDVLTDPPGLPFTLFLLLWG